MKKVWLVSLLIAATCVALALDYLATEKPPQANAAQVLAAVQLAAPQSPPVLAGLPNLAQTGGQITIVHTWASWCPPCVAELPQLIRQTHGKSAQINVIALNSDPTPQAMESAIAKAYQAAGVQKDDSIQWLADPAQTLGSTLTQSRQLPETLILSGTPKQITHHFKGPAPWPLLIPYFLGKK